MRKNLISILIIIVVFFNFSGCASNKLSREIKHVKKVEMQRTEDLSTAISITIKDLLPSETVAFEVLKLRNATVYLYLIISREYDQKDTDYQRISDLNNQLENKLGELKNLLAKTEKEAI